MDNIWKTAALRALIGATLIGATAFLSVWSQTDDVKLLVTATVTPMLSYIGVRLGIEGYVDNKRAAT